MVYGLRQILKLRFKDYTCDPAVYLDIINARNGSKFLKYPHNLGNNEFQFVEVRKSAQGYYMWMIVLEDPF